MNIIYFTEEAYEKLINEIQLNKNNYINGGDWLSDYFRGIEYCKNSTVQREEFELSYIGRSDEEINHEDFVNAINLYKAFENLTPLQASNKLMWTYLCHETFEEYVRTRWLSKDIKDKTIRERYFIDNRRESLFLNALSRLWWAAYISYDEENSNRFHLTKILFSSQRIFQEFARTKNSMNKVRAKGVLLAIQRFKDENLSISINDAFRACNKYLNRMAAISNFDTLTSEEIEEITFKNLKNYKKSH